MNWNRCPLSLEYAQSGCHQAGEPKSQGNEPHSLVFVFFAFFAVNLDCSLRDSSIRPFRIPLHQSVPEPNCLEFGSCLTAKNAKNPEKMEFFSTQADNQAVTRRVNRNPKGMNHIPLSLCSLRSLRLTSTALFRIPPFHPSV